jgi:calcium-dependent protein kinase
LFNFIKQSNTFSEKKVADIMKQILSAVLYMHNNNIVHRDLKPENILYEKNKGVPKIIDFGTAIELSPKTSLSKLVGSIYYLAPEVIKGNYNEKCDIWSCGIILYVLLCGHAPFYSSKES